MKKILVSIRDLKAKTYMFILHFNNHADASRWFCDVISDERSQLNKHPRDYALHKLGSFDQDTGEIAGQLMEDVTPYEFLDRLTNKDKATA